MASINRIVLGIEEELLFSDETGLTLTRIEYGESQLIENRVNKHGRLRSPQDNLNPLETIEFHCIKQKLDIATAVLDLFKNNYGKVFTIRSYIHNRIFVGFIDEFGSSNPLEFDTCVNVQFTILIKNSFSL